MSQRPEYFIGPLGLAQRVGTERVLLDINASTYAKVTEAFNARHNDLALSSCKGDIPEDIDSFVSMLLNLALCGYMGGVYEPRQ